MPDLKDEDFSTYILLYRPLLIFVRCFHVVQMYPVFIINPFTMIIQFLNHFRLILDWVDFNLFFFFFFLIEGILGVFVFVFL